MSLEINYTLTSSDSKDYSIIRTNLRAPPTHKCEFMVSSLTTTCNFTILDNNDYIEFIFYEYEDTDAFHEIIKIQYPYTSVDLNLNTFVDIMNHVLAGRLKLNIQDSGLISFKSYKRFGIIDLSYNMKLVMGMYNEIFNTNKMYYIMSCYDRSDGIVTTEDFLTMEIDGKKNIFKPSRDHSIRNDREIDYINLFHDMLGDEFRIKLKHYRGHDELLVMHDKYFRILSGTDVFNSVAGLELTVFSPGSSSALESISCSVQSTPAHYIYSDSGNRKDAVIYTEDYIEIIEHNDGGIPSKNKYHPDKPYTIPKDNTALLIVMLRNMLPSAYMPTILPKTKSLAIKGTRINFHVKMSRSIADAMAIIDTESTKIHSYRLPSVGYFQLTPVLYLISNIGNNVHCYTNREEAVRRVLMRINNYFIHGFPIVCSNMEFTNTIESNDLSNVWFQLVDANFKPVKLHAPIYLTAIAVGV